MNEIQLAEPRSEATKVEQSRAVAEVAAAVRVALEFPRTETTARDAMVALCGRTAVAERAFYEVPNRGAGMSIHIARELARIWGNVDYGVRELNRDDTAGMSEMQAWAWDQQTNVRSTRSFLVPHERMKGGRRQKLGDLSDIYLNNQNIGSRAVRECIFSIVPDWFLAEAEQVLKRTLREGEGESLPVRIDKAVEKFSELDITVAQLVARVGRPVEKWEAKDLVTLTRIYMTISVDGIPAREYFPEQPVTVAELTSSDPADPDYVAPEGDR